MDWREINIDDAGSTENGTSFALIKGLPRNSPDLTQNRL